MEPITKLLIVTLCLYVVFEVAWWFAMQPPSSLSDAMSRGFPSDGYELKYVKTLARQLRQELKDGENTFYVLYAFSGTYIRRQYYGISSGVFHMNLLAGSLFGAFYGLLLVTVLVTIGCLLSVFVAQYITVFVFMLCDVNIETGLPPSPAARLIQMLKGQNQPRSALPNSRQQHLSIDNLLKQVTETAVEYKRKFDEFMETLQGAVKQNQGAYSGLHLILRLLPILPSWLINQLCAIFFLRWTRFALTVAIGYLPYNYYTVAQGTRLDSLQHLSDLYLKLTLSLVVAVALLLSITWLYVTEAGHEVVRAMSPQTNQAQ